MTLETRPFDVAEYLDSPEMIAAYLEATIEEADPSVLPKAIGDVARAIGMTNLANDAGLKRESLYKALSDGGNPTFETLSKVLHAMGLKLTVEPVREHA